VSADRSTGFVVPSGRRAVLGVAVAVLLVVGVGLLLARAAGFAEVRDAIASADSTWFVVCFFAQLLALSAYAEVFRGGFAWGGRPDPGFGLSAHVMLASIGATRVFAAGGVGAIAVTYWCFRRARFTSDEALVRVLGFNALFYVAFGIGVWTAALVVALGLWGEAPVGFTAPWLVLVPACAVGGAVLTQPRRVERITARRGSPVRRVHAVATAALAWVRAIPHDPGGWKMLAATVLYWAGGVACLWAALRSVGVGLPLPELVLAFAAGHAAMILPLPLGGVGGVDAALTYSLTAVGVPLGLALVAVGVYRLFTFWAPTIPALAALLVVRRAGTQLARLETLPSLR
jgi:glycosyltransferase 2 family protein